MTEALCVGAADHVRSAAATLEEAGYQATVVADASAAQRRLPCATVGCVVTAHDLPDGSGLDLVESVDTPAILCPDDGTERLAGRAMAAGAAGYVPASAVDGLLVRQFELAIESEDDVEDCSAGSDSRYLQPPSSDDATSGSGAGESLQSFADASSGSAADASSGSAADASSGSAADGHSGSATDGGSATEPTPENYAVQATSSAEPASDPDDDRRNLRPRVNSGEIGEPRSSATDPQDVDRAETCGAANRLETSASEQIARLAIDDEADETSMELSVDDDRAEPPRETRILQALQWATGDFFCHECTQVLSDSLAAAAEDVLAVDATAVYLSDADGERLEPVAARGAAPAEFPPVDGAPLLESSPDSSNAPDGTLEWPTESGDEFPVETVEWYAIGDRGLLCLGHDAQDGLEEWSSALASLLAATGDAALDRADREIQLQQTNALLEAATDGVLELAEGGTVAAVDDAFASLVGVDRERLLGRDVASVTAEGDQLRLGAVHRELQAKTEPASRTLSIVLQGDRSTAIDCEITLATAPVGGEERRVFAIVRDASDRSRLEQRLETAERRLENAHTAALRLESVPDVDAAREVAVETARTLLAADRSWIVHRKDTGFVVRASAGDDTNPEATPSGAARRLARRSLVDGSAQLADRLHSGSFDHPPDGDGRSADASVDEPCPVDAVDPAECGADASTAPDTSNAVSGVAVPIDEDLALVVAADEPGTFDDVDRELAELLGAHLRATLERLRQENDLGSERDRIAALFDNVPIPVVRTRVVGDRAIVDAVNPSFERVFGYDTDEIVDEPLDEHIVPPDRMERASELTSRGQNGELLEAEVRRLTANGTRDFRLTVVPVTSGDAPRCNYAIYTDVTERKQRQQRLEVLNRVLRHDLRNGMNVVKGSAELLEEHVEGGAQLHVEAIERRASEMIDLAEKTRTVQRSLQTDPTDVGPVDVVDAVQQAIEELDVAGPKTDIRTSMPAQAKARVGKLLPTAVGHVLENAVVHHDGEPTVEVTVEERDDDRTVEVVVADDGPGIPESERTLVTEQQEITQLRHGSGLGLWIVNWIVTGSGGSLEIETAEPHGTVVRMKLPQAAVDRPGLPVQLD